MPDKTEKYTPKNILLTGGAGKLSSNDVLYLQQSSFRRVKSSFSTTRTPIQVIALVVFGLLLHLFLEL